MKVTIQDRDQKGRGRCQEGLKRVLVSQAHPGEEVLVRVDRRWRGTLLGRVERILRRDPQRVEHPCPHEFHCTGCAFLAAPRKTEILFKEQGLEHALGSLDVVQPEPLLLGGGTFGYRHLGKMVLSRGPDGCLLMGSYVAGTHQVVDNQGCPVLVPQLRELFTLLQKRLTEAKLPVHGSPGQPGLRYALARCSRMSSEMLLTLVTSSKDWSAAADLLEDLVAELPALQGAVLVVNDSAGNALLAGRVVANLGQPVIEERLAGHVHRITPGSFFQVNPEAAELLVQQVLELAGGGKLCVETHAGVGALTLPLLERFDRVIAIEEAAEAISALNHACERAGLKGLEAICGDVRSCLAKHLEAGPVLVMDPPRAGLGTALCDTLVTSQVKRLVLVSCSTKSLARDLADLRAGGFYTRRIVPLDLFPRTSQVEVVTLLEHATRV